jgi:hypothetical protein
MVVSRKTIGIPSTCIRAFEIYYGTQGALFQAGDGEKLERKFASPLDIDEDESPHTQTYTHIYTQKEGEREEEL